MPFKSEAQRKFLFANHPEIAKEFASHTPKGTKLPKKVADIPKMQEAAYKKLTRGLKNG